MSETVQTHEQEKQIDPRVESLAIPLARDYAEKNYAKIGEDESGKAIFEPAWRGASGEKDLRGKSPSEVAADLIAEGWTSEAATAQAETMVVDIANTPYDQFSEHWKDQNRGGAEYLITLLDDRGPDALIGLNLSDSEVQEEFGSLIHDNWIARNEWVKHPEWGNPELARPFGDLSPEEQQKDIDQVAVLQGWIEENYIPVLSKSDAMELIGGGAYYGPSTREVDMQSFSSGDYVQGGINRSGRVPRSSVPSGSIVKNRHQL